MSSFLCPPSPDPYSDSNPCYPKAEETYFPYGEEDINSIMCANNPSQYGTPPPRYSPPAASASPRNSFDLPPGWKFKLSAAHGQFFFYQRSAGASASTWKHPVDGKMYNSAWMAMD